MVLSHSNQIKSINFYFDYFKIKICYICIKSNFKITSVKALFCDQHFFAHLQVAEL